jgi:hypothetical protein
MLKSWFTSNLLRTRESFFQNRDFLTQPPYLAHTPHNELGERLKSDIWTKLSRPVWEELFGGIQNPALVGEPILFCFHLGSDCIPRYSIFHLI